MSLLFRSAASEIRRLLSSFPAVGIVGPRQVGKTTLVKELLFERQTDVHFLDLEDPRDLLRLQSPFDYFEERSHLTIVIDEIQIRPELFTLLRPLIDADRRPGRFVLLGSASPEMMRGASESLAGRIAYVELTPLTLVELAQLRLRERHWLVGGYPEALLPPDPELSFEWRASYVETYMTRELPALGSVAQIDTLRKLFRMIAVNQGGLFNQTDYARSLGVSHTAVSNYVQLLERAFLLRRLRPYHPNVTKRLTKAPKLYVRDSGLLHAVNFVEDRLQLSDSLLQGASWEGYVIEQLAAVVSRRAELYFYRTQTGVEMDLVVVGRRGKLVSVEIKRSSAPKLTRGSARRLRISSPISYWSLRRLERLSRARASIT